MDFYAPKAIQYRFRMDGVDETWIENGGKTAFERANLVYRQVLQNYQPPEVADPVRQELEGYVTERRRELELSR